MPLSLLPVSFEEACRFIKQRHRHHRPPQGWKFGVAVGDGTRTVGVVTIGRPVARNLDDGLTLEVTRCCTDGTKNAASMLYGAAWRAAKALGYKRIITYTLANEPGVTLSASGWHRVGPAGGGRWNRKSRPRGDEAPLGEKTLWEERDGGGEATFVRRKVRSRRQGAHSRLVSTRTVSFACAACHAHVSQERFPGPTPRYCSARCKAGIRRIYQKELMRKRRARSSAGAA